MNKLTDEMINAITNNIKNCNDGVKLSNIYYNCAAGILSREHDNEETVFYFGEDNNFKFIFGDLFINNAKYANEIIKAIEDNPKFNNLHPGKKFNEISKLALIKECIVHANYVETGEWDNNIEKKLKHLFIPVRISRDAFTKLPDKHLLDEGYELTGLNVILNNGTKETSQLTIIYKKIFEDKDFIIRILINDNRQSKNKFTHHIGYKRISSDEEFKDTSEVFAEMKKVAEDVARLEVYFETLLPDPKNYGISVDKWIAEE